MDSSSPTSPALTWLRNAAVVTALAIIGGLAAWVWLQKPAPDQPPNVAIDVSGIVMRVNAAFEADWASKGIPAPTRADDLTILRRLSLALTGSIPSLEDIREVQAMQGDNVPERWLTRLLADRRTSDYLAERLARVYVGTENGPFLIYRRRRLVEWLSDALLQNRPYDRIVRELIESKGVWTTNPAVNFITVTNESQKGPDEKKLAAKVSRAFLGVRIDCVECHDGKLGSPWKQSDFHQLAAYFGQTKFDFTGLRDDPKQHYQMRYLGETEPAVISAKVPWKPECMPDQGPPRSRLADWVTAKENKTFARTLVNRFWALLFNKPLIIPVDDLPLDGPFPPGMELLAEDFIAHDFNLHRLIRVITTTRVFEASSVTDHPGAEAQWAAFPVTRLRPEQMAGSVIQAASLCSIDAEVPVIFRIKRDIDVRNFVKRYGDKGEDDFDNAGSTIPQRLLLMNGNMVTDHVKGNPLLSACTRIGMLSPDNRAAVESAYLAVFTRKPSAEESAHFEERLASAKSMSSRSIAMSDLYWTLMNATEFSWNH